MTEPYFMFFPSIRLDAVFVERSDVEVTSFPNGDTFVYALPSRQSEIVLRRNKTANDHIWSGCRQLGQYLFFSDELGNEVIKRGWGVGIHAFTGGMKQLRAGY